MVILRYLLFWGREADLGFSKIVIRVTTLWGFYKGNDFLGSRVVVLDFELLSGGSDRLQWSRMVVLK